MITEEQEIRNKAEKVLAAKGKKSNYSYYQPPIYVGGDYMVHTTKTKFKKEGLTIIKYEKRLDDEICEPSLIILDAGNGIFRRFFNALGMYYGNIVFLLDENMTKTFERGTWQRRLETLVN